MTITAQDRRVDVQVLIQTAICCRALHVLQGRDPQSQPFEMTLPEYAEIALLLGYLCDDSVKRIAGMPIAIVGRGSVAGKPGPEELAQTTREWFEAYGCNRR